MDSLEATFQKAVAHGVFPGAILLAKDKSVMTLASMTKLLTSIAAMQLVERGLVKLEDDVSHLIPDLAQQGVLAGFDNAGKPIVEKRQNPIELRHLLTHSAGAGYDSMYPDLVRYRASHGQPTNTGTSIAERFGYPLTYEPGTSWAYGTGIDWAGQVVEKITGLSLETYMDENIWKPLGIKDISFWPEKNPEMMDNFAGQSTRDKSSGKVVEMQNIFFFPREECMGGHGLFGNLESYMKIVHSILVDDEKLLKKETAAQMFKPQLTKQSKAGLKALLAVPAIAAMFPGGFPSDVEYDWGIGGILVEGDGSGKRKRGTLIWSGMPNLFWFIDREAGLCGVFGTQVFPPGDAKVAEMINLFELAMNEKLA